MRATALPDYLSIFSLLPSNNGATPSILGSRLIPKSFFESPQKVDALAETLSGLQYSGAIIHLSAFSGTVKQTNSSSPSVAGGKVSEVAEDATAVHPSWRRALHHVIIASGWLDDMPVPARDM